MFFIKNIFLLFTCSLCSKLIIAQANKPVTFTAEAFLQQVKQYHPVARQANLLVDKAGAELLSAKGGFDPVISTDAYRKTFDGKNYYYYTNPELKIPTPVGVNLKTGMESNGGNFMNPELTRGNSSYAGIEMPLGKGLLIDKRRAVLQQAKIFQNQSEQERLAVLNDLFFAAYTDYLQWTGSFQLFKIYSKFIDIASDRLRLVRIAYNNGDRALLDTIEAYTQLQSYQLQQSDALLQLNKATFELSNYLWQQNNVPAVVPAYYEPDTELFTMASLQTPVDELIEQSQEQNPEIKMYEFKMQSLDVERKLKFQNLLPTVNFSANILNKDYNVIKGLDAALFRNNYKWGLELKVPIFLREGRGDYRLAKLKLQETDLQLISKRWQVENKIRSYYNENKFLQQQVQTAQSIYNNYDALLRNEELKFKQGESSLFLVNSRETKMLEMMQKLIELRMKYYKSKYAIQWAAGLLR